MAFTTLSLGLTLTIPVVGARNWGTTLKSTTWTKISQHQHTGTGDGNKMVTASYTDNSVTSVKLAKSIAQGVASTLTPAGTSQTIDLSLGNNQTLDLSSASGTVTVTLSNPEAGGWYNIWIVQGATFRDITWPASVKWPQAQAAILTQTNGAVDLVKLYYTGSVYRALWELDFS